METAKENNEAPENFNNTLLETMNDRGILASYLLSPSSKITNPEEVSLFKLVKDLNSSRVNDLLKSKTIPFSLFDSLLTFLYTDKKFELQGDLLKTITNKNYNVDLANLSDKKIMFEFAKEMFFDEKTLGNKSARDNSLIRLLCSPAILGSGTSTIFLPENLDELCDRINFLLQEKQTGKISNKINEEIVAIAGNLLEHKCKSNKQHKFLPPKYLN